jgi:phosphonate metabolism protein PhnN/1,5-bisphosphokinase (PRPP-forming)
MSGLWAFVCGPSGAGKDSVMAWAEVALRAQPRIVFARRIVTRAASPDAPHDEMSPAAFARLRDAGGLAWHWRAHGHDYGIRAACAARVAAGDLVVVNGSREHVAALGTRADLRVAIVTAPEAVLRQRLTARGRDRAEAIVQRMDRSTGLPALQADLVISNDRELAVAGAALRDWLLGLASEAG